MIDKWYFYDDINKDRAIFDTKMNNCFNKIHVLFSFYYRMLKIMVPE